MMTNLNAKNVLPSKEIILVNYVIQKMYAKNVMVKEVIMVQMKYGYVINAFLLVMNVRKNYIPQWICVVEKEEVICLMKKK